MSQLNLIGMFRVGTNYTRSLMELNYDVEIRYNAYGWKHGPVPTFNKESDFNYSKVPCICVVKNPLATVSSWWKYINDTNKNIKSDACSFSDFLKQPVVFYDEWSEGAPEYWFSSPFDMWNSIVWNHVSFVEKNNGKVVRYEDLITDPEKTCAQIASYFSLNKKSNQFITVDKKTRNMSDTLSREGYESYVQGKEFDRINYFKDEVYLGEYSCEDFELAKKELNQKLLNKFDYYPLKKEEFLPKMSVGVEVKPEIYTMCSDSRLYDLSVLLESLSALDYNVNVIPYDDDLNLTRQVCDLYGATLVERDPFWDEFGKKFFADADHGDRKVKAWKYFRKFNAISHAKGDFLFIDSNAIFLQDLIPGLKEEEADIVFAHKSSLGRNFRPWGKYLISSFDKEFGEGFGADFWFVKSGALKKSYFEEVFLYPGFKNFVSTAPEQSFLNIVVFIKKLKYKVFQEIENGLSYFICTKVEKYVSAKEDGFYYKGDKIAISKWTGDYHNKKYPFNHKDMHKPLVISVMRKVSGNRGLYLFLRDSYSNVCGHDMRDWT